MTVDNDFRRLFKLSESMEMEVVFAADELGCPEEELLDAILLAYFWHNYDLLKLLYEKGKAK